MSCCTSLYLRWKCSQSTLSAFTVGGKYFDTYRVTGSLALRLGRCLAMRCALIVTSEVGQVNRESPHCRRTITYIGLREFACSDGYAYLAQDILFLRHDIPHPRTITVPGEQICENSQLARNTSTAKLGACGMHGYLPGQAARGVVLCAWYWTSDYRVSIVSAARMLSRSPSIEANA